LILALASCSVGTQETDEAVPTSLAFQTLPTTTTTLLIDEDPNVSLTEDDEALVRFEAAWVCELQRRTFSDPTAIKQALDDKLIDTGLSSDAYTEFRQRVNTDQGLRESILFEYQETCRT